MNADAFRMTIPSWFSKFHAETYASIETDFKSLCDDSELDVIDPCYTILKEKKDALERVLDFVAQYFKSWEPRECDNDDVLACLRNNRIGDVANISFYLYGDAVSCGDDEGDEFSTEFIFAARKEHWKRTILQMGEFGIRVGWNSGDGGVVCLREDDSPYGACLDSPEEFFDAVLGFDWGHLVKATVRYGAFSIRVNLVDSPSGDDYEERARDVMDAILSGSQKLYDLAAEALDRDFNGGSNYDEHLFDEDYVLRYARAIVDSSHECDAPRRMAEHDLAHIFTQMRKYERMSFDYAVLQEYSDQSCWRRDAVSADQFMRCLYQKLPKRLYDQCTRGAVGLPDDEDYSDECELL